MPDISTIVTPDGQTRNIKDSTARNNVVLLEQMNGAKNTIFEQLYTVHTHDNLTYIVNIYDSEATLIADGSATLGHGINTFYYRGVGDMVFIVIPPTGVTGYDIRAYDALAAPANEIARVDNVTPVAEFNFTGVGVISFVTGTNISWSNAKFKIMMLPKSVYDAGFTDYKSYSLPNIKITPELIELVDSGPKNLIEQSSGSDARWVNIDCDLEPGTYVVSVGTITTTYTTDNIQVTFFDSNWINCAVGDKVDHMMLTDKFCVITTDKRAAHLRVYASPTTVLDKVVTFTNLMVCTKSAWDVSKKYVPYRPSYEETVEQVAATRNQANFNTNNGVKNFATINNFTYTGYYMDVPIDGSLSGEVTVHIGNIISTDTDASTCALLFIYTDDSSSAIHLINRGASTTFSANTGSNVIKSIRIYPSDTWVHSANDTVTVTNFMVAIKSIYDEAPGYQPYAISNTRITPELIELVDSGAKNVLDPTATSSGICTVNSDRTITVNGSTTSEIQFVIRQFTASEAAKFKGMILSGCPSGGSIDTYSLALQQNQSPWGTYATDTGNSGVINTSIGTTIGCYLLLVLRANKTYDNLTFKPMICSKAAWDVSHAYVPYGARNNETIISNLTNTIIDGITSGTYVSSLTETIAGIAAGTWVVLRAYNLNQSSGNALRLMQILEDQYGTRKTRLYYNGAWLSWA